MINLFYEIVYGEVDEIEATEDWPHPAVDDFNSLVGNGSSVGHEPKIIVSTLGAEGALLLCSSIDDKIWQQSRIMSSSPEEEIVHPTLQTIRPFLSTAPLVIDHYRISKHPSNSSSSIEQIHDFHVIK